MVRFQLWQWSWCVAILLSCTALVAADEAPQALLDEATALKLSAESIADLNKVVTLCSEAIEGGLDEGAKQFANELLASTLTQRADLVCTELFERPVTPNRARKLVQTALADLEKTIEINPDQAQAQYLIGRLYAHLDEPEKGLKALDNAVRLSQDDATMRAKVLMIRASLKTDAAGRQADYDEAVKLQPRDPNVLRFRGMFYLTQNDFTAAIRDLRAAVDVDPKDADTHEALGIALSMAEKYDDAMESFNKAIELDPEAASALTQRARVRAIKGDSPAALADVERALKLQPGSAAALQLHATLLAGAGQFEQALAEMNLLHKAMPDSAELAVQLAALYQAAKQPQKAIVVYDQLLLAHDDNVMAYRGRADVYLSLGKQTEAIADYERSLKLDAKNSGVLNNLAWVLATSPDEKCRDGKRAIELATLACDETEYKQAHILSTLAAAYAETGDFDTAIKWSTKAVELGTEALKAQLGKELESYQAKKPWREEVPPELTTDGAKPDDPAPANENAAAESKRRG